MTEPTTERAASNDLPQVDERAIGDPSQFTYGLIYDVVKALEAHGYGPFDDGRQLVELSQHLIHFLHDRSDRCYGTSAVTSGQKSPAQPAPTATDKSGSVEAVRADGARKLAALRQSGDAVDAAMVRYDQRWGHEL
jgi:hypothetical protein